MFWKSKRQTELARREEERRRKIAASQLALLEAATTTADAAHHVTTQLKKHLEDTVKQFETTMKIINDALIICDANGTIKAVNPSMEKMFSCYANDIVTKNIKTLFRTASDQDFWSEISKDTTKGLRQNGEVFSINVKVEKMTKSDDSDLYLVLIVDFTEQNHFKKTAKEFEQRYCILFDQCIDGIIILQDGQIVASNEPARRILNNDIKDIKIEPGGTIELNGSSGELEFILSGANITWNDKDASLITIKDIRGYVPLETCKKSSDINMIVCFDAHYIITYVNEQFCTYYGKSRAELFKADIRTVLNQTELAAFLVSINSLTVESPMKRIQVHVKKNDTMVLQDWVDYANFDNGVLVEYQRTGRDITDVLNTLITK